MQSDHVPACKPPQTNGLARTERRYARKTFRKNDKTFLRLYRANELIF